MYRQNGKKWRIPGLGLIEIFSFLVTGIGKYGYWSCWAIFDLINCTYLIIYNAAIVRKVQK